MLSVFVLRLSTLGAGGTPRLANASTVARGGVLAVASSAHRALGSWVLMARPRGLGGSAGGCAGDALLLTCSEDARDPLGSEDARDPLGRDPFRDPLGSDGFLGTGFGARPVTADATGICAASASDLATACSARYASQSWSGSTAPSSWFSASSNCAGGGGANAAGGGNIMAASAIGGGRMTATTAWLLTWLPTALVRTTAAGGMTPSHSGGNEAGRSMETAPSAPSIAICKASLPPSPLPWPSWSKVLEVRALSTALAALSLERCRCRVVWPASGGCGGVGVGRAAAARLSYWPGTVRVSSTSASGGGVGIGRDAARLSYWPGTVRVSSTVPPPDGCGLA